MKKITGFIAVVAILMSSNAMAELDISKLYAGGGAALNRNGDNGALGFQGFGGYDFKDDFKIADRIGLASELGFSYSGKWDFGTKVKGLWLTAVLSIELNDKIDILNRLGYSFADKNYDGIMTGLGLQYKVDEKISVRGEVVMQYYKSYQVSGVFHF